MLAGNYGEVLLRVADQLCAELPAGERHDLSGLRSPLSEKGLIAGVLTPEEEALVRKLRAALAEIAIALGATPEHPIGPVLDGGEMVVRRDLKSGRSRRLPELMPSLVFLVALPIVEQDRALELSDRVAELIAEALQDSSE